MLQDAVVVEGGLRCRTMLSRCVNCGSDQRWPRRTSRSIMLASVITFGLLLSGQVGVVGERRVEHAKSQSRLEKEKLQALLEVVYHEKYREFPEYATYIGYHNYDDALETFTMDAFDRRKSMVEGWMKDASRLQVDLLSRKDQREIRILKSYLQTFLDGHKWRNYGTLNSVNFLEGLAKGPQWPLYTKLNTKESLQNYLKRMAAVPAQIDQQINLMRKAIRLKRTNHVVSVNRVPAMLDQLKVQQYFAPFQAALKETDLPEDIEDHMWQKALELLGPIELGMKRMKSFLLEEYVPATRAVEGVHSLPHGLEYYQACLNWYLGMRITPEEIFELGVREVNRIELNIKKIIEKVSTGFNGDLKSFFQYVKYIPKFYNHTKEDVLIQYNKILKDIIQPKMSRMFYNVNIPSVTVVPVENDGPWGSYGQNVFYVNLKEPKKRSTFTMLPLALHETNPGHHFQESYTRHFNIPGYRADIMNGRLFSVPFHFPVYSAYAEGWALYAEYLGEEMGLYEDPFYLFGRYCSEIFRACRLVVDSGIHAFGWSRERAITFISNFSDFPASQIEAEVDRYITWPGQACAYKVGEIKIKELRRRAEEELGRRFDVKEFHHELLKIGNVPLEILEEVVLEWIDSKKQRPRHAKEATLPADQSRASVSAQHSPRHFLLAYCVCVVMAALPQMARCR